MSLVDDDVTCGHISELPAALLWDTDRVEKNGATLSWTLVRTNYIRGIIYPKGPNEKPKILWRAGPKGWTQFGIKFILFLGYIKSSKWHRFEKLVCVMKRQWKSYVASEKCYLLNQNFPKNCKQKLKICDSFNLCVIFSHIYPKFEYWTFWVSYTVETRKLKLEVKLQSTLFYNF